MNNPSPLIPQGSLLEQRTKGRARVKIAVFLVLAIHGVGLMALLMQGCKKDSDGNGSTGATETNNVAEATSTNTAPPVFADTTNTVPTNTVATTTNLQPQTTPAVEPPPVQPTAPAPSDYVIVKGDTFSTVAKKFHTTPKALMDANPSVEPTKLKIGQTIHIPVAAAGGSAAASANVAATGESSADGQTYTVKSGDTLSRISSHFGISVPALRTANHLKTTKIFVGQKLKIPGKAGGPTSSTTTTASNSPSPMNTSAQ